MRFLIAVLLSAALFGSMQETPAHINNVSVRVSPHRIVVIKTASVVQPTPVIQTATVVTPVTPPTPSTPDELMAAAGIAPADFGAADYIISNESSWSPDATNPTTGAHGLPQALPYSKTGCGWDDAICQLSWANTYAISRYGGWWPAYYYWVANHSW